MKLYEIMQELELALTPDENGEITQEQLDLFEGLELAKNEKIENIACWIKNLRADADAIKAEEKSLADRRRAKENHADRLAGFLSQILQGDKFESARCKVSFRKSEQIEIINEDNIPAQYFKITKTVMKSELKQAVTNGLYSDGAKLTIHQNIQIK
jgi:hypothetical protein